MPSEIKLPMRLSRVVEIGLRDLIKISHRLQEIADAANSAGTATTLPSLAEQIGKKLNLPEEDVFDAFIALWNLRNWQQGRDETEEEFASELASAVAKRWPESWPADDADRWLKVISVVPEALKSLSPAHPIFIFHKAQSLAYSHQNLLMSSRVITDFRPVFDEAGEKILETIILHKLLVQYSTGHQDPSIIEFALDSSDLRILREACERAERKEAISTKCLRPSLNPVVYPEGRTPDA